VTSKALSFLVEQIFLDYIILMYSINLNWSLFDSSVAEKVLNFYVTDLSSIIRFADKYVVTGLVDVRDFESQYRVKQEVTKLVEKGVPKLHIKKRILLDK
jgi:thiamine transporter ThiT